MNMIVLPLQAMAGGVVGSMLTRKALNSGVSEFASPTTGVREFGPQPLHGRPP